VTARPIGGFLGHMPTAILFPGQGSHTPDMRDRVAALRPDLLEAAVEFTGEDPFPRAGESTRFAQPAIVAASLASWSALCERDEVQAAATAGHSLGELSALAAAEAISERDAIRLAAIRGRLMHESGARRGDGTMLAALGGDDTTVTEVAERAGVTVANDNAPGQLVLSGARAALAAAGSELRARGVRVLELDVAGAFHSPFMADALPDYTDALNATYFRRPRVPVWSCVTTWIVDDPRGRLAEGLTSPVRWRETIVNLHVDGIDRFVEAGPGQVLTRMLKRTLPGVEAVAADRVLEVARA
jgi:malonyl CoA-acyl carrier protein transacylase